MADAQTIAETILQAHPDLTAFVGIGGSDLPGIAGALKSSNTCGTVKAVGFDVVDQGIEAMRNGCVDALISQKPFGMTAQALDTLIKMHDGHLGPARRLRHRHRGRRGHARHPRRRSSTRARTDHRVRPTSAGRWAGPIRMETAMSAVAVRMQGMSKRFPGVIALDQVDLEVRRGEVMALVGENGAGKSTLLKILAGMYTPDAGVVEVGGEVVQLGTPRLSQAHGIAVIHQELNLAPHLSVAENIWVGREPRTRLRTVDFGRMRADSAALLRELGIAQDPDALVGSLSIARQQMVEIAKALSADAGIVVMDEPTSSVTEDEVDVLLDIVRRLRDRGVAVIYVSHRLREIFDVADRITVLRDGRNVGEVLQTSASSPAEVVNRMVGRDIDQVFGHRLEAVAATSRPCSRCGACVRGHGSRTSASTCAPARSSGSRVWSGPAAASRRGRCSGWSRSTPARSCWTAGRCAGRARCRRSPPAWRWCPRTARAARSSWTCR